MARISIWILLPATFLLVAGGLAMITSTSAWTLQADPENPYQHVFDHLQWMAVGLVAWAAGAAVRYQKWRDWLPWIVGLSLVLLALCFAPGVGQEIYGERRWIALPLPGPLGKAIQPSEFAKFALVILLAAWFAHDKMLERRDSILWGILAPLAMAGVFAMLILAEVDIGTTAVVLATALSLIFVAGARLEILLLLIGVAAIGFVPLVEAVDPEKLIRLEAWQDLEAFRDNESYQQVVGLDALMSGGITGVGLGNSVIKIHDLPFAHTDFIAAILGDELGFIGSMITVFCFLVIGVCGLSIAIHAPDRFGKLLGSGLVAVLVLQALLNLAVVTALVPNTGLPLPFISYGGTNLVMSLFFIGVLTNIYRQANGFDGRVANWVKRKRRGIRW